MQLRILEEGNEKEGQRRNIMSTMKSALSPDDGEFLCTQDKKKQATCRRGSANKISSRVKQRSRSGVEGAELTRGLLGGAEAPRRALRRKYDETIFRAGSERMLGIRCEYNP